MEVNGASSNSPTATKSHSLFDVVRIFSSASIYISLVLFAKSISFGKEITIASMFGVGDPLDAYFIGLILPTFMINVVSVSVGFALVPRFIAIRAGGSDGEARKYLSSAMAALIVAHLLILPIICAGSIVLGPMLGGNWPQKGINLAMEISAVLAPAFFFGGMRALWGAVLEAERHFAVSALLQAVTPLTIIGVLLLLGHQGSVWVLAFATSFGYFAESVLSAAALWKFGLSPIGWRPDWSAFRSLAYASTPIIFGAALMSGSAAVDQSMAAHLGQASLSIYNFGIRITAAVLIIITGLGRVAFPYFSNYASNQDWSKLREIFSITVTVSFVGGSCVALILYEFAHPLIALMFGHGAFGPAAVMATADVHKWYALQIPFYIVIIVAIRLLMAIGRNGVVLVIAAASLLAKTGCNLWLEGTFGLAGIAAAAPLVSAATALAYVIVAARLVRPR